MTDQHGTLELIDIESVANDALLSVLGPGSPVAVDTSGAAFAPLALGDRRSVSDRLRRLIVDVLDHTRGSAPRESGAIAPLVVSASLTPDASIRVRVESGAAWRELRLPLAGASPLLDVSRLAQIQRYGFLRLAPLAPAA